MDYVSEKNLALLIDAENISYKYISTIFDELKADWNITIKRIYGDFSKEQLSPWNDIVSQYALTQIQQLQTTSGKNSSDMALVINAMDILYRNNVDAFCIVSSDSDFSRLISRLKQEGKFTIGMGESKTSKALINCCDQFKYLNLLYDSTNDELNEENISLSDNKAEQEETSITPLEEIKSDIIECLESNDKRKGVNIGEIKRYLKNKHSDFDTRNYGCAKFSTFLKKFNDVIEINTANSNNIKLITTKERKEIENYVRKLLETSKNKTIGYINQLVLEKYPNFTPKDYGYKQVKLFFTSIDGIELSNNNNIILSNENNKSFSNLSYADMQEIVSEHITQDDFLIIKSIVEHLKNEKSIKNNLNKAFELQNINTEELFEKIKPYLKL